MGVAVVLLGISVLLALRGPRAGPATMGVGKSVGGHLRRRVLEGVGDRLLELERGALEHRAVPCGRASAPARGAQESRFDAPDDVVLLVVEGMALHGAS